MIVYISTKLLLIGIIKNYNRGSFILAVISFAPASINIVSRGLPIRMEAVLQVFGEDREAWSAPSGAREQTALDNCHVKASTIAFLYAARNSCGR